MTVLRAGLGFFTGVAATLWVALFVLGPGLRRSFGVAWWYAFFWRHYVERRERPIAVRPRPSNTVDVTP